MLILGFALLSVAFGLQAGEYTWVGASNDWYNVASYTVDGQPATTLPGRDDEILLPSGSDVYADDSTIAFFGTVGAVHMKFANTRFTLTLTTNAVFACPIGQLTKDDTNSSGTGTAFTNHIFIKEGPGKLTFDTSNKAYVNGAYNLNTGFHVKQGELDFGASWGAKINHTFKRLIVEENATVYCMASGSMYFKGIWGGGTIVGPAGSSVKFYISRSPEQYNDHENKDEPTVFSGKITGNFNSFIPYGSTLFTGVESDFTANVLEIYGMSAARTNATCGFMHLGTKGTASSLGTPGTVSLTRGNVIMKYLGTTDEETNRDFTFYDSSAAPLVVDAGSSGSLTLNGVLQHQTKVYNQHRVTFSGSNLSAVSVVSNKFTSTTEPVSGEQCSFFVRKSGPGTWRFADRSADSALSGVVGVDGGTLEFETIRNIGEQCSLGDATDLYEDSGNVVTNLHTVPYAHFIGGAESDAVFSYVGSEVPYIENRPVAVTGNGRFQAGNCEAFGWKGFMGIGTGEKRITYACAAGQTNLVANVTDANGGAEGTLSVVKDGPGDLVLSGDLSFGGDIIAKGGGTLRVRDLNGASYEYYRLVMKETAAGSPLPEYAHFQIYTTTSSKGNGSRMVALSEFGLYDSSGTRLNQYAYTSTNSSTVTVQPAHSAMEHADQAIFGTSSNAGSLHFGRLFDCSTGSGSYTYMRWSDNQKYLRPDDPSTWMKIVVRLPKEKAGAASFDLNYVFPFSETADTDARTQPTAFSIEGSADGMNWTELYATNNVVFEAPNYYFWLSSMTSAFTNEAFASSNKMKPELAWHGRIPLASTADATSYTVLDNVRAIGAAAGTKLVFESENGSRKAVSGLKVDVADGIGTFENFALAANGTLYVDGVGNANVQVIPGDLSGIANLGNASGWSLSVNGAPTARYKFTLKADGIKLFRKGIRVSFR